MASVSSVVIKWWSNSAEILQGEISINSWEFSGISFQNSVLHSHSAFTNIHANLTFRFSKNASTLLLLAGLRHLDLIYVDSQ